MRIAVVAPEHVPPVSGGAERLYEGLVDALNRETEHTAQLVSLPSPEFSFSQLVDSYSRFLELDLSSFDKVISTKYPSWMVRHPNHVVYMLHPLRGLYEMYPGGRHPSDSIPPQALALRDLFENTPLGTSGGSRRVLDSARWVVDQLGEDHPTCAFPGPLIRDLIRWLDADAMHPRHVSGHFAISRTVAERPGYFAPDATPLALPPPSALAGLRAGPFQNFFTASRLDRPKRIDLLIEAMAFVDADVQLRIAGSGPDGDRLRALAAGDSRIVFLGRIDEDSLKTEYSSALAVPFVPLEEDFGLVAVEAQRSHKPVITCLDSGGVTDLVEADVSGFVVEPGAEAIGAALSKFAQSPGLAAQMGARGAQAVGNITWPRVINGLLREPTSREIATCNPSHVSGSAQPIRPRVVVMSTYRASNARGGGQLRINRLLGGLANQFDVELLALDTVGKPGVSCPMDGVREAVIDRGTRFRELERALQRRAPIPTGDIAASLFATESDEYVEAARRATDGAAAVIVEHPYLLPVARLVAADLPLVYDAHNDEVRMKRALIGRHPNARNLMAVVKAVESEAVRSASLVVTCSEADRVSLQDATPTLASWALIPNGADVLATEFVLPEKRGEQRDRLLEGIRRMNGGEFARVALFVGSYHPPNIEAAEQIVRAALHLPKVAFFLVGNHGIHFANWRLPKNVLVTGTVSDHTLQLLLGSADIALNPMESGGGTNLKLVEYFATGTPVVTSELGIRGVDATEDEHVVIADGEDLASAIKRTLGDASGSALRAARARRLAEEHYDWSDLGAAYADAVGATLASSDW